MAHFCRLEKEKVRIAKDTLFELSVTHSSRLPGDQGPAPLLCKARKAFCQLRNVFEDDLNQQGHVRVFGERLSFDLKLENGGLRDIPQDKYHQIGDAIGMARDREPLPLPKTTQTSSQEALSGIRTKPSKAPAKVKASPTSAHKPTNDTPSGIPVRNSDREEDATGVAEDTPAPITVVQSRNRPRRMLKRNRGERTRRKSWPKRVLSSNTKLKLMQTDQTRARCEKTLHQGQLHRVITRSCRIRSGQRLGSSRVGSAGKIVCGYRRHHHQFFSSFSTIDQLTPGGAVLSRLLARI